MMSWSSSVSRSGTGREPSRNNEMYIGSQPRAPNVAWNWRICASPSPEAGGSRQILGTATPWARPRMKSSRAGFSGSIVKPPPPMARIVGSGRGKRDRRPLAEVAGLQRELHDLVADRLDPVGARRRTREQHAVEVLTDEMERRAVGGRIPGGQRPVQQRGVIRRPPVVLFLVVHRVGVREAAEPVVGLGVVVVGRQPRREPAE